MSEIPSVSLARLRSEVPGPRPKLLRLLDLIDYKNHPIERTLRWLEDPRNPPVVSAIAEGDASVLFVHGTDAMHQLTLQELKGPWRRPEAGFLTFKPGSKEWTATRAISTSNGEEWKRRHARVNSGMRAKQHHEHFRFVMTNTINERCPATESLIDPMRFGLQVATDNTWNVLFGLNPKDFKEGNDSKIQEDVDRLLRGAMSPLTLLVPLDVPFLPYGRLLRSLRSLYDFFRRIAVSKIDDPDDSVVSLLLDQTSTYEEVEQVIGDLVATYITGRDGPAASIAWTLLLLALHPTWQREIRAETPHALESVINESLRLLPPSYVLNPRIATEDTVLGGVEIPRGAMAMGSIIYRHRSRDVWGANADRFVPERWIGSPKPGTLDFMPFGQGPRRCLGDQFARLQLETIKNIIDHYWIEAPEGAVFDYVADAVLLRPKPCQLRLVSSKNPRCASPATISGTLTRDLLRL